MPAIDISDKFTFRRAFDEDETVHAYGENALALFALALYLRLEDVDEFASSALTAGPDDKKVDICYIDEDQGRVIIAQAYMAEQWAQDAAPSNKASDLTTAMAWLLSASQDLIPQHLRTKATELRAAIRQGTVTRVEILLIHNCMESINAKTELKTAADSTRDIIAGLAPQAQAQPVVAYREFGLNEIEDLFRSRESEILIDDIIEVPHSGYIKEETADWIGILASVPAQWITSLYQQHGERLFSANYRDYLGFTRRNTNINFQITQTARDEPDNFWVYNNGITALTYKIYFNELTTIRGISIINGAQTTGALADTPDGPADPVRVLIRIVECRSPDLIDKIIRFNNTQNEIKPADRRSNDVTQRRLRADFESYGVLYIHRRTTARTPRTAITAAAIAPALCAFNGDPATSYRNSKDIFNEEATYQRVFPLGLRVEHVFLVRALSTALDALKADLKARVALGTATAIEERQYEVMKYSASKHFLFYVCGRLAEQIMATKVSDIHEWRAIPDVISPGNASLMQSWREALQALLPLLANVVAKLGDDPYYDVPRSFDLSKEAADSLEPIVASLQNPLASQFSLIRDRTTI